MKVKVFDSNPESHQVQISLQFFIPFTRVEDHPSCLQLNLNGQQVFSVNNRNFFKNDSSFALKRVTSETTKKSGKDEHSVSKYYLGVLMPFSSENGLDLEFIPMKVLHLKFSTYINQSSLVFADKNGVKFLIIRQKDWTVLQC